MRGIRLVLSTVLLVAAQWSLSAAVPPALSAAVDALEKDAVSDADFRRLLARIDAEGSPALKARAFVLQCQRNVGPDPRAMRRMADEGVAIARDANAQAELGGLLLCRGYIEESDEDTARALADYSEAIAVSGAAGMPDDAAQARVLRGELLHGQGRYAEGLSDMQAAHRHYVATRNEKQQSYTLNAIANFYADSRVGQYDKALQYYRQLLAAHLARRRVGEAATTRYNIASTLDRKGDYREALTEFRASLAGYEAEGDIAMVADTLRAIAALQLRADRATEALDYAERAMRQASAAADPDLLARVRVVRGGALRRLGRGDAALADFEAAEAYFAREKNGRFLEHLAGERAEAYAGLQQWERAFAARSRQLELSRALDKQLEQDVTARMRVQFDSERTERENAALQRTNALRSRALVDAQRIRRLQAAVIALGGAVLAGMLWLAWRFSRRAKTMRVLALTDELTGLPNRRAILDRLTRRLRSKNMAPAAVIIFDIDHFKSINDRRGHDVGDSVLRRVAETARREVTEMARSSGHDGALGRIGGEEFLVLLAQADEASATAVGERLRAAIEALRIDDSGDDLSGDDLRVTISLGGSQALPGVDCVEDALKRADLALYRAKEAGRNRMDWQPPPAQAGDGTATRPHEGDSGHGL
jgi:diguanylate cyclase (GGDEF)-like protein